jgi:hypothetical protein
MFEMHFRVYVCIYVRERLMILQAAAERYRIFSGPILRTFSKCLCMNTYSHTCIQAHVFDMPMHVNEVHVNVTDPRLCHIIHTFLSGPQVVCVQINRQALHGMRDAWFSFIHMKHTTLLCTVPHLLRGSGCRQSPTKCSCVLHGPRHDLACAWRHFSIPCSQKHKFQCSYACRNTAPAEA